MSIEATRPGLLEAMESFDKERDTGEWRDWELRRDQDYAVIHNGRRYPPERVIALATGAPSVGIEGANALLREHKFVVERLRPEPADNARFSYLLAILDHVARERPTDVESVRSRVLEAVSQLATTRGDTRENYRESFNKRTIGVAVEEFHAIVLRALQGDHAELGALIRKVETYANYIAEQPDGSTRLERVLARLSSFSPKPLPALNELFDSFNDDLKTSGLRLPDGFASAFLASALAKPFIVLAGLSGSGKTQLALKLGQWLGRMRLVAVRPDWTGPEHLLGYEDALRTAKNETRRPWFVPDVLEFLLEAAASEKSDDPKPFVLILDEMNLAHVERYFADVLSGMESREAILPDLERGPEDLWFARSAAKLTWPRNVVVIGTVNVDETTYSFSPKVLDRAFTLEFRVETRMLPDAFANEAPRNLVETSEDNLRVFTSCLLNRTTVTKPASANQIAEELRLLHERLAAHGWEFGFRTLSEASRLASIATAGDARRFDANAIIDLVVMQKVLPRLHGGRKRLEPLMLALGGFCERSTVESADPATLKDPRLPKSADKLARMMRALRNNQFTSFAEA